MKYLLIAIGVGLSISFGVACLIVTRRDVFARHKQTEPNPILLPEFRPGGDEGRPLSSADTGRGRGRA
jgi:hypothetical protein